MAGKEGELKHATDAACSCDCGETGHGADFDGDGHGWLQCACVECGPNNARCTVEVSPIAAYFMCVERGQPLPSTADGVAEAAFCGDCREHNQLLLRREAVLRARLKRRRANETTPAGTGDT